MYFHIYQSINDIVLTSNNVLFILKKKCELSEIMGFFFAIVLYISTFSLCFFFFPETVSE